MFVSIMLSSQYKITIIFTVKFEIINLASAVNDSFESQSSWKNELNYTVALCN